MLFVPMRGVTSNDLNSSDYNIADPTNYSSVKVLVESDMFIQPRMDIIDQIRKVPTARANKTVVPPNDPYSSVSYNQKKQGREEEKPKFKYDPYFNFATQSQSMSSHSRVKLQKK